MGLDAEEPVELASTSGLYMQDEGDSLSGRATKETDPPDPDSAPSGGFGMHHAVGMPDSVPRPSDAHRMQADSVRRVPTDERLSGVAASVDDITEPWQH